MQGLLKLFLLAGLFTISLAQCSGSFSNATQQVTLEWTVIDNNTVNFIYTAPATSTQYTALAFSNQPITAVSLFGNVALDAVYAGSNGTYSFVQDRWVQSVSSNVLDTDQNLEDTNATLSNGSLTVNFTRPIISPDKTQDLDLNTCKYVIYLFNGTGAVDSIPSPYDLGFGILPMQLCLQNCEDVPSPSTTIPSSTGAVTISTTSVESSSSISRSISASVTTIPTSSPSAATNNVPLTFIILIAIVLLSCTLDV